MSRRIRPKFRRLGSAWPVAMASAAALLALAGAAGSARAQRSSTSLDASPPSALASLASEWQPHQLARLDRLLGPPLSTAGPASPLQDEIEPTLLDQALGGVWAAAKQGAQVYLAVGSRVVVLERGPGGTPSILASTASLPDAVLDLTVQEDRLYVVAGGVHVFDVSDPSSPRALAHYDAPTATELHVDGDRMILLIGDSLTCGPGVEVVDIADSAAPSRLSRGLTCTQDYAVDMDVEGDLIYVVTLGGVFYVFRMDDQGQLGRVGGFYNESIGLAIEVVGNYAYFSFTYLFASGVFILDVSDPSIPTPLDIYAPASMVGDIQSRGDMLYMALGAGVEVLDIDRPTAPRRRSIVEDDRFTTRVELAGEELLALGGGSGGLRVLELSDPAAPTRTAERALGGSVQGVAVDEGWLLVASEQQGMWSREAHDPAAVFSSLSEPGPATYPFGFVDVEIADGHAFVAASGGLAVLPLGAPASPDSFAQATSLPFNSDLALAGDRAYLAGSSGLTIFDVSTPMAPRELGRLELPGTGDAVAAAGDSAYVADGEEGLHHIDVSDPSQPALVDTFMSDGDATGVAVGLGHVLVAAERGLHILELTEGGDLEDYSFQPGPSRRVRLVGDRAYELTPDGLRITDLEEPGAPFTLSEQPLPGSCVNIQVVDNVGYVACESGGLVVLDVGEPAAEPATPGVTATSPPTPESTPTAITPTAEATPLAEGIVYLPLLRTGE